jgi:RNA polymerase subunit RPABC4/transcription elongation factor Spt4
MIVLTSCSWCHALNPVEREVCAECGHLAQVARSAEPLAVVDRERAGDRARAYFARDV